jgi:hypothetical protein
LSKLFDLNEGGETSLAAVMNFVDKLE